MIFDDFPKKKSTEMRGTRIYQNTLELLGASFLFVPRHNQIFAFRHIASGSEASIFVTFLPGFPREPEESGMAYAFVPNVSFFI